MGNRGRLGLLVDNGTDLELEIEALSGDWILPPAYIEHDQEEDAANWEEVFEHVEWVQDIDEDV